MKELNYELSTKVASRVMQALEEIHECNWKIAFEDYRGKELMEELGVCKKVIQEYLDDL